MAIFDRIIRYSVRVGRSDLSSASHTIGLTLESGGTASLAFVPAPPANWLSFSGSVTSVLLRTDAYAAIYHLLQTEAPVFLTALDLFGIKAASVHTELDLGKGEPTGEGYDDKSLEALVLRAREAASAEVAGGGAGQPGKRDAGAEPAPRHRP
jgi:hypothetical protein